MVTPKVGLDERVLGAVRPVVLDGVEAAGAIAPDTALTTPATAVTPAVAVVTPAVVTAPAANGSSAAPVPMAIAAAVACAWVSCAIVLEVLL